MIVKLFENRKWEKIKYQCPEKQSSKCTKLMLGIASIYMHSGQLQNMGVKL